ncbi:segregation and condensation protein A [Peptostreptococcus russellii]|uniref:segregation and condensation protein A n=1 Tax=Peptostreptococcus russellii TaxID=215200 RepID=UPI0029421C2A|nr:segregation/condensation protein A [Peptostreptococcus russellii]
MEYSIQTKKYEGPMELLLDLIKRNKIDISDISIVEITEQYVDYVDNMDEMNLDFASDFIDMAARLLEIKSRYILYLKYNSEDEEDPRKELVQKIEEYKKFREITDSLRDNIKEYDNRFYREKEEYLDENDKLDLSDITIDEIAKIALKIFRTIDDNEKSEEFLDKNEKLKSIVRQKNISVESRIDSIREKIKIESKVKFSDILESKEKREVIASFLAILELIKMKEIVIRQEGVYQDIIIRKKDENEDIIINDKADKEYEKLEKKASRRMERKFKSQQ